VRVCLLAVFPCLYTVSRVPVAAGLSCVGAVKIDCSALATVVLQIGRKRAAGGETGKPQGEIVELGNDR
jgi:hypothetical protein